jgi:hypothetical protein
VRASLASASPNMSRPNLTFALFAGLAAFALAAFSPALFHDGDTYWHITAGAWMLDHHLILRRDVFSYTAAGAPWDAQEWLAEIAMALAWRAGGWMGLHLLFGVAAGLAAAVVAGACRARLALTPALLATVLGLACVSGSLLARPHLLALPLLAIWVAGLVAAREKNETPHWALLAVMPLWANLHGSFAFGLALAAALGIEAVLENGERAKAALGWSLFVAAAIAVALLTPQGLQGLLFPLRLAAMPALAHIGEWGASDFSHPSPFALALLAILFVLGRGQVKVPVVRLLILLGLTWLALAHQRHQMLLGIAGPLLLAPSLARAWPSRNEKPRAVFAAAGIVVLAGLVIARIALPVTRGEDAVTPQAALAHVPRFERELPVLNDYAFGGYLIWNGVHPFIDSRADLYGNAFLENYAAVTAPDAAALASTLAYYHVRWTIFPAHTPVVRLLDALPGWHRLYGDDNAVVHVHD